MYKAGFSRHISWLSSLCDHLKNGSIPYSCRTVYEGRNKVIACKTDSEEVNIKIFRKPGILKSIIYGWLRPTKARRSFNHSLRLLDAGIATPQPLAFIDVYSPLHTLGRSYYVSEQLVDEWKEIRYMEERPDYRAMVEALGKWVAGVHLKGVLVKDLSPGNILFRITPQGYEFCMVDVNRMGFDCRDRRRQLYRAGWLMNSEQSSVDFARHYAFAAGMDSAEAEQIVLDSYRRLQRRAKRKHRSKNHRL